MKKASEEAPTNMKTRRGFIAQTAAALAAGTSIYNAFGATSEVASRPPVAPRKGLRIKSALPRDETIRRLGGDGMGGSPATWTADDRQLLAAGDSCGWPDNPKDTYYANYDIYVDGDPENATFHDVLGYPKLRLWDWLSASAWVYYSTGVIAVDGHIYQYLTTSADYLIDPTAKDTWAIWKDGNALKTNAAKLIHSPDGGRTWCNHDGSTPVVWEWPRDQTPKTTIFSREPQEAFSEPHFVQMGKDYSDNRDGYVYVFSQNSSSVGGIINEKIANQLMMFRVQKARILDRSAYEFFAGLHADGNARWSKDINARREIHTFPAGWPPRRWGASIVFNAPLGAFMMVGGCSDMDFDAPNKPARTYLAIWVALNPWGPWSQLHEDTAWKPAGDPGVRTVCPVILPKWISDDGKSFWWSWGDAQATFGIGSSADMDMYHARSAEELKRIRFLYHQYHPYLAFNIQRVDLIVG